MNGLDAEIKKYVKRVRRRLSEKAVLQMLLFGMLAGFGAAVVISLISLFVPWYFAVQYALIAVAAGVVAGMVLGILKRPDMKQAALRLDAQGFQERLITSYELAGKEDSISIIQKRDTLARLKLVNVRKLFPLKPKGKQLAMMFGLAAVFLGLSFVPTAAKDRAQEQHAIAQQVKDEVAKVDDAIEKIEKMEELSQQEKEELLSLLQQSRKELSDVDTAEALEKAKERIAVKVDQQADQTDTRAARQELRSLADSMQGENQSASKQLAQGLQDLQKDLENMDDTTGDAEKQAIADEMQQLAEQAKQQADQTGDSNMQQAAQSMQQDRKSVV